MQPHFHVVDQKLLFRTEPNARCMLARQRLGLKRHRRSSPVTGGLVLGVCLQATRAALSS